MKIKLDLIEKVIEFLDGYEHMGIAYDRNSLEQDDDGDYILLDVYCKEDTKHFIRFEEIEGTVKMVIDCEQEYIEMTGENLFFLIYQDLLYAGD